MASRALTKEVRSLISKAGTKARKRAEETAFTDKMAAGAGGAAGALASAVVDGRAGGEVHTFEVMGMNIPTNAATGLVATVGGLALKKGPLASALAGGGMTQLNIALYRAVLDRQAGE